MKEEERWKKMTDTMLRFLCHGNVSVFRISLSVCRSVSDCLVVGIEAHIKSIVLRTRWNSLNTFIKEKQTNDHKDVKKAKEHVDKQQTVRWPVLGEKNKAVLDSESFACPAKTVNVGAGVV